MQLLLQLYDDSFETLQVLAMSWVCQQFVIVVFPDHTHLLFFFRSWSEDVHIVWIYSSDHLLSLFLQNKPSNF